MQNGGCVGNTLNFSLVDLRWTVVVDLSPTQLRSVTVHFAKMTEMPTATGIHDQALKETTSVTHTRSVRRVSPLTFGDRCS